MQLRFQRFQVLFKHFIAAAILTFPRELVVLQFQCVVVSHQLLTGTGGQCQVCILIAQLCMQFAQFLLHASRIKLVQVRRVHAVEVKTGV